MPSVRPRLLYENIQIADHLFFWYVCSAKTKFRNSQKANFRKLVNETPDCEQRVWDHNLDGNQVLYHHPACKKWCVQIYN